MCLKRYLGRILCLGTLRLPTFLVDLEKSNLSLFSTLGIQILWLCNYCKVWVSTTNLASCFLILITSGMRTTDSCCNSN